MIRPLSRNFFLPQERRNRIDPFGIPHSGAPMDDLLVEYTSYPARLLKSFATVVCFIDFQMVKECASKPSRALRV